MKKYIVVFLKIALLFMGYSYLKTTHKISYDFYYWKSTYELNETTSTPKYIKVLDIAFHETLTLRKTIFKHKSPKNIVPVIYIDNVVWKKMKATTMVRKVLTVLKSMPLGAFEEIQVDCDWTNGSQKSYFKFLKLLHEQSRKTLSATIRLHQVKYYQKTGVPPVDYGVLMYYNMSDFQDLTTKNYILDLEVAKRYHYNFETYPLALNLALPLYSQATIMRFSEVVGLMEGVREEELNSNFKAIEKHRFEVSKTHYFKGKLFYEGDQIRVDEVTLELLRETIEGLKGVMKQPKEIVFYRWGNLDFYGRNHLDEVVERW